jgi:hypothetical protein
MAQGLLPYKYEEARDHAGMTALAGLPIYLDLASVLGIGDCIRAHLRVRESGQGWTDEQTVLSLILLNLAGGDCVEDMKILEKDEGFSKVLSRVETKGITRRERRAMERRWRKECHRSVPSPSALFRYLEAFHDPEEEKKREPGKAFIPASNEHLQGLREVNRDFVASIQRRHVEREATLDMDPHWWRLRRRRLCSAMRDTKLISPSMSGGRSKGLFSTRSLGMATFPRDTNSFGFCKRLWRCFPKE